MSDVARTLFLGCLKQARTDSGYSNRHIATTILPFSPETIGRHERGEIPLSSEDIVIYAKAYERPDLLIRFCSSCSIGKNTWPQVKDRDLPWVALRVSHELRKAMHLAQRLQEIAMDGNVTEDEQADFQKILEHFRQVEATTADTMLWAMNQGISGVFYAQKNDPICSTRIGS